MINFVTDRNFLPFPSLCISCGTTEAPFIVFDATQDWNGALIICKNCIVYVATLHCGLIRPESKEAQVQTVKTDMAGQFDEALSEYLERLQDAASDYLGRINYMQLSDSGNDASDIESDPDQPTLDELGSIERTPRIQGDIFSTDSRKYGTLL